MTALDKLIVNMYGDYTPTDAERAELLRRCAKVVAEAIEIEPITATGIAVVLDTNNMPQCADTMRRFADLLREEE